MRTLVLYHDFTSPFCRVALEIAADVAARVGARFEAVPYELRPAPTPLPEPGDPALRSEIEAARPLAESLDLPLEPPPLVPRTHKAHEAVAHARASGLALPVLRGLYEAFWREGADIGRIDVIADIGAAAGVDRQALHVALGVDETEAAVDAAQREADAAGIAGVPAVRVGDRVLLGLVPAAELLEWVGQDDG